MTIGINEVLVGTPPRPYSNNCRLLCVYRWFRAVHFRAYFIVAGNIEFVSKIGDGFKTRGCTKSAASIGIGLFIYTCILGFNPLAYIDGCWPSTRTSGVSHF
jgi:hypothetical protein